MMADAPLPPLPEPEVVHHELGTPIGYTAAQVLAIQREAYELGKSQWIPVSERLPEEDQPVWARFDDGHILICARYFDADGWLWGRCYLLPYHEGGKWKPVDVEGDDDYRPTHWHALPDVLSVIGSERAGGKGGGE